jgi:hypothetical protein
MANGNAKRSRSVVLRVAAACSEVEVQQQGDNDGRL